MSRRQPRGMRNVGNTCWINSFIQSVRHVFPRDDVTDGHPPADVVEHIMQKLRHTPPDPNPKGADLALARVAFLSILYRIADREDTGNERIMTPLIKDLKTCMLHVDYNWIKQEHSNEAFMGACQMSPQDMLRIWARCMDAMLPDWQVATEQPTVYLPAHRLLMETSYYMSDGRKQILPKSEVKVNAKQFGTLGDLANLLNSKSRKPKQDNIRRKISTDPKDNGNFVQVDEDSEWILKFPSYKYPILFSATHGIVANQTSKSTFTLDSGLTVPVTINKVIQQTETGVETERVRVNMTFVGAYLQPGGGHFTFVTTQGTKFVTLDDSSVTELGFISGGIKLKEVAGVLVKFSKPGDPVTINLSDDEDAGATAPASGAAEPLIPHPVDSDDSSEENDEESEDDEESGDGLPNHGGGFTVSDSDESDQDGVQQPTAPTTSQNTSTPRYIAPPPSGAPQAPASPAFSLVPAPTPAKRPRSKTPPPAAQVPAQTSQAQDDVADFTNLDW